MKNSTNNPLRLDNQESTKITQFDTIRQGKATNQLTKVTNAGGRASINPLSQQAIIQTQDIEVFIANYEEQTKDLSPTTYRLLDALTVKFTDNGSSGTLIELPLTEYMERCGLKDKKSARAQVQTELDNLYRISINWQDTDRKSGKQKDFIKVRLCDSVGIKKGIIFFNLTPVFFNYLSENPVMPYPKKLYRINAQYNPHSFYFLRRIAEHKNMNNGKSNEDIIAVRTLLESSPVMPLYEDIEKLGQIQQRIIEPFERDMDNLSDTLTWEYVHRNGVPLTDAELKNMSYELFSSLMIHTTWLEYPARVKKHTAAPKKNNKAAGQ